jgi:hypothetical protein
MKALICFHKSSDVPPHSADIDTVPRQGDWLDLPDVSSRNLYPVERVIFRLTRTQTAVAILEVPMNSSHQVEILLGKPVETKK